MNFSDENFRYYRPLSYSEALFDLDCLFDALLIGECSLIRKVQSHTRINPAYGTAFRDHALQVG